MLYYFTNFSLAHHSSLKLLCFVQFITAFVCVLKIVAPRHLINVYMYEYFFDSFTFCVDVDSIQLLILFLFLFILLVINNIFAPFHCCFLLFFCIFLKFLGLILCCPNKFFVCCHILLCIIYLFRLLYNKLKPSSLAKCTIH